ncbi:RING-type E3 ubiquitin transferase [Trifolium repens]|nr:RING-type E3 ubiquitin transferase [Trifolium repens]
MKPEREKEIRPGERERSGGAPEREGGAARGRSDDARGCDGGSKVILRRPERTIWSGSATAVGDGSGTPWTEEGSTYSNLCFQEGTMVGHDLALSSLGWLVDLEDTVIYPVSLTCGHIFCYICACSAASVSIVHGLKAANPKERCPLCREEFQDLKTTLQQQQEDVTTSLKNLRSLIKTRVASAAVVKEPTIGAFPSTNAAIGTSLADITPVAVFSNLYEKVQQGHFSIVVESNAPTPAPDAVAASVGESGLLDKHQKRDEDTGIGVDC